MKLHYTKTKLPFYILSFLMAATFISCGSAQTVTGSDDGIYADEIEQPQRRVIVTDDRAYDEYQENYFTKEVERLGALNGTDIFTDIEKRYCETA